MAVNQKGNNNWGQNFGEKVRQGAEIVGGMKTLWETGKALYGGFQAIAPYVAAAAAAV
jgi:hypothetical protein